MTIQTAYTEEMAPKVLGGIANQELCNTISRIVEETGGIPFGRVVARGTSDDQCLLADAGATSVLGISARYSAKEPTADGDAENFAETELARILTQGVISVTAAVNVTAGQSAFYVIADGGITNVDDATTNAIPGAVFDETAASGQLVNLRIS